MTKIFLSDDDLFHCDNDSPEDLKVFLNEIRQAQAQQEAALQQATRERDEAQEDATKCRDGMRLAVQQRDEARAALEAANTDAAELFEWANVESAHDWRCKAWALDKGKPCTCGLDKALQAHRDRAAWEVGGEK